MIKKIMKIITNGIETKNSIINSIIMLKTRVSSIEEAHLRNMDNVTKTYKTFIPLIKKIHTDMHALTKRIEQLETAINKKNKRKAKK